MMWPSANTKFLLGFSCVASFFLLVGCGKAQDKNAQIAGSAKSSAETTPVTTAEPPRPDPSRTDPEAAAQRRAWVNWKIAGEMKANEALIKAQAHILGADQPAPSGNYGRMSDGLASLPAEKK